MARTAKATQEAVIQAAEDLAAHGLTPTVKLVRERTGGSFTTVKEWLDGWTAARTKAAEPQHEMPAEVQARGQAMLTAFWQSAVAAADARVAAAQASAKQAIMAAEAAAAEVTEALRQQEAVNEEQAARIETLEALVTHLREERDQARTTEQVATAHVIELEQRLDETQQRLTQAETDRQIAFADAQQARIDHAHQAGELAALRQQLADQAAIIARLTTRPASRKPAES